MKLKIYSLLLAFCSVWTLSSCDDSDDVAASNVPQSVRTSFEQMLPGVTAHEWENENGLYKADFYREGREGEIWFQADGTWVRTKTDVYLADLPQAVTQYVETNYSSHRIDDADWVETTSQNYYLLELEKGGKPDVHLQITAEGAPL